MDNLCSITESHCSVCKWVLNKDQQRNIFKLPKHLTIVLVISNLEDTDSLQLFINIKASSQNIHYLVNNFCLFTYG